MRTPDALNDFLLACRADGLRPATLQWYRSLLSVFVQDVNSDLENVTPRMIRQYIVGLEERADRYIDAPQKPTQRGGLSKASVAAHVRALHAFWKWCEREYQLTRNPMENIKRQRVVPPEPKAINGEDFVKLFNATEGGRFGERDRAILVFFADTGARLGGLITLTLDNLFIEDQRAIVREKGQRTRSVVFTAYTARILLQWLAVRPASDSRYVFTSQRGAKLTESGVNQLLNRLKARAKVDGRVNPHSFRHGFAREYLRNGGDLATLARLLGHSDISTTAAYYAVFSQDELADLHEKFSPLNSIMGGDDK